MSKLEQLKEKAKGLEAKDPKKAVEIWLEALQSQDDGDPDLSMYNRIGDLYIKLKDPGLAADYYDQAVDKYAELGFHNNAIAMCNKVLRNAPARQSTYLKLAKLREMLSEHLKMYGNAPAGRPSSARASTAAPKPPPQAGKEDDLGKSGKRKTSSLVFLDLDAPRQSKRS